MSLKHAPKRSQLGLIPIDWSLIGPNALCNEAETSVVATSLGERAKERLRLLAAWMIWLQCTIRDPEAGYAHLVSDLGKSRGPQAACATREWLGGQEAAQREDARVDGAAKPHSRGVSREDLRSLPSWCLVL